MRAVIQASDVRAKKQQHDYLRRSNIAAAKRALEKGNINAAMNALYKAKQQEAAARTLTDLYNTHTKTGE